MNKRTRTEEEWKQFRVQWRLEAEEETRVFATRNGQPWLPKEDAFLKLYWNEPTKKLAKKLRRSYAAVSARKVKLNMTIKRELVQQ